MAASTKKGVIYVLIGAVTWGLNGVVTQFLFMNYTVNSAWLTAIRMIGAGLLLLLTIIPTQHQQLRCLFSQPHEVWRLCIFAVCGLLLCQYAYLTAIKYSNSGTATVLQTLSIVLMAIFLAIRHRKIPVPREIISILLAVGGVFLIATHGNPSAMIISASGLFWGLTAAIGAVIYPLLSHDLAWRWSAAIVNGPSMVIGGLLLLCALQLWNDTPMLDVFGWAAVAFIIFVGTAVSFTFFVRGISIIGPMKSTLIGTLEPVIATIVSAVWLGTAFQPIEIVGFVFILATVFLLVMHKQ